MNSPRLHICVPAKKKTEKTYHRFLEALKILAPESRPDKIFLDFEQAAIQAFQKNFPDSKLSRCFFHLSQSYMRKIKKTRVDKLANLYGDAPSLRDSTPAHPKGPLLYFLEISIFGCRTLKFF